MVIGGLQKTTLIDYPGKIACTVFTVGCNFRCPFCHNRELVTLKNFQASEITPLADKDLFSFLKKRKKILDGVCITGGEPTIHKDLPDFIRKIKKLGFLIKLDSNGSNPRALKKLIDNEEIDFIAIDFKGPFDKEYLKVIGLPRDERKAAIVDLVKQSMMIVINSGLDYEFRTTIVPGLHDEEVLVRMAKQLREQAANTAEIEKINWVWQNFRPKNCLDPNFEKIKSFDDGKIKKMLAVVRKIIPTATVRGIEL